MQPAETTQTETTRQQEGEKNPDGASSPLSDARVVVDHRPGDGRRDGGDGQDGTRGGRRPSPWLTGVLALALAMAIGWGSWQSIGRARAVNLLEARYQQAFYGTMAESTQAEINIDKALAAQAAGERSYYLAQVWQSAGQAEEMLSSLPLTDFDLTPSRKFLGQVADYAHSLADREAQTATGVSVTEQNQLVDFRARLASFNAALRQTSTALTQQQFRWTAALAPQVRMPRLSIPLARNPGTPQNQAPRPASNAAGGGASRTAAVTAGADPFSGLAVSNDRLAQFPSLTYDGPFSDSVLEAKPRGLTGVDIDEAAAKSRALQFARLAGPGLAFSVRDVRTVNGPLPGYMITVGAANKGGGERGDAARGGDQTDGAGLWTITVSRRGGQIIAALNDKAPGRATLGVEEAHGRAQQFADSLGLHRFQPTYSLEEQGSVTVQLVPVDGDQGIYVYPDMIKIRIGLDDGQVLAYDALSYWTNHHERPSVAANLLSADEAAAKVNPALQVSSSRLAIIPKPSGREVLAWEVHARRDKTDYLIYINAYNGEEEEILLLIPTQGGQLTM